MTIRTISQYEMEGDTSDEYSICYHTVKNFILKYEIDLFLGKEAL
jgi:hypothetical protein